MFVNHVGDDAVVDGVGGAAIGDGRRVGRCGCGRCGDVRLG
jgi:hypothetical protein